MNPFAGQQWKCRLVDAVGEGGAGQTESSVETYALPYVKLDGPWKLSSALCGSLEAWDGWEGEVPEGGDICTPAADSC